MTRIAPAIERILLAYLSLREGPEENLPRRLPARRSRPFKSALYGEGRRGPMRPDARPFPSVAARWRR